MKAMRHFSLTLLLFLLTALTAKAQMGIYYPSEQLSNSLITSICQDKTGYIWVGTDYGLNRFDGYRFVKYFNNAKDTTSLMHNAVVSLCCDNEGTLWVGTNRGLQRYDHATDRFETLNFPRGRKPRVNTILQMKNGRMLVGTAGYGLYEIDRKTRELKALTISSLKGAELFFSHLIEDRNGNLWKGGTSEVVVGNRKGIVARYEPPYGSPSDFFEYDGKIVAVCRDKLVMFADGRMVADYFEMPETNGEVLGFRVAHKDRQGNVFIGTRGNGLYWIPAGTRRMLRYHCTARGVDMTSTRIWAITEDRNGNLWLGCQQRGLLMIPSRKAQFSSWNFSDQKMDIGTYVTSISDGSNGITWCTVQDKGVYGFDLTGKVVAHPQAPDGVEYLYHDSKREYWLGTTKGMYRYDPEQGRATLVTDFPCYVYNTVTDDHQGHMFFSAFSKGMLMYDREAGKVTRYFTMNKRDEHRGRLCNDWIMDLSSDMDCNVWAATSSGVCCYDPKKDTFMPHGWEVLLKDTACYAVCKTSKGDMLIGTECGLYVWLRKQNRVERFRGSEAMGNIVVGYMVEDNTGNIWCSTSMGIWRYDVKRDTWTGFVRGNGLTAHEYVNSVGMHGDDERIFFATGDGMTVFSPEAVNGEVVETGKLMLTAFLIGGNAVSTLTESNGTRVTELPVAQSHRFEVSYLDNSFTMEFSLLNYVDAANTIFEYRLDGKGEWLRTEEGQNVIRFGRLASGKYRLEVRAIDNGVVSEVEEYIIVVTAPWYRTTTAYIIYVLLLIVFGVMGAWMMRKRVKQRIDEDKMTFLVNTTHDIRSPLTLIMTPLKKLKEQAAALATGNVVAEAGQKMSEKMSVELSVIESNANRILQLVNQILDIQKIDNQQLRLSCRETELGGFVKSIYMVYEYAAKERGIDVRLEGCDEEMMAWIDRQQFDKVLANLLSNALKYCFDNGEIVVRLSQGHDAKAQGPLRDYVEVEVTDNGIGMHESVVPHIFDRFYQERMESNLNNMGTGIGLHLCKMIVEMHHGSIQGRNRTDGTRGSVFTVRLPKGSEHLTEEEKDMQADVTEQTAQKAKQAPRSNYRVLIVDDDEQLCSYLREDLSAYYHCAVCHNGKEGLKELLANSYDAVVSDVMMPEMDGFTMLRMLKTNVNISHIPVILLTSKSDIGNRLEGLEKGADAYMTKPFALDELRLTIDNLIANHLRLKGKFSGAQQPTEQVAAPEVKGNDEQLMERIIKSVNEHLSDSEYGVETMCEEVGISRAHLHRKMKEMTGIPVSEFIRNIRLEQAARLLREQKLNITQVAYAVGFSSLGYFSTVFRKHFGISPREFMDQQAS